MQISRIAVAALLFSLSAAAAEPSRQVDALFREFSGNRPGASVMVIHKGKVVLKKAYGLAEVESMRKATPRTNYRLASVTKQFTATCILMLAERGRLSLDDPLTRFFADFPDYGQAIRVRHLLNHTSGLPDYEDLLPVGSEPVLDADVLEILKKTSQPYFAAGTQFRYSNSGYSLLALIVEKVSGTPFGEFLRVNVFAPLKMERTHMNLRHGPPDPHRAYGYSKDGAGWKRTDQSRTSFVLGDGGIYSSVEDLEKWLRSLDTARLLPRERLRQAMSASVVARALEEDQDATAQSQEELGYGFGWFVSRYRDTPAVWHGGSTMGFRNHLLRLPKKELTVIVLTNRNEADAAQLARRVADCFF